MLPEHSTFSARFVREGRGTSTGFGLNCGESGFEGGPNCPRSTFRGLNSPPVGGLSPKPRVPILLSELGLVTETERGVIAFRGEVVGLDCGDPEGSVPVRVRPSGAIFGGVMIRL